MAGIIRGLKGLFQFGDESVDAARAGDRAVDAARAGDAALDAARAGDSAADATRVATTAEDMTSLRNIANKTVTRLDDLNAEEIRSLERKFPDLDLADPDILKGVVKLNKLQVDDAAKASKYLPKFLNAESKMGKLFRNKIFQKLSVIGINAVGLVFFLDELGIDEELIDAICGALDFVSKNWYILIPFVVYFIYVKFFKESELESLMKSQKESLMQSQIVSSLKARVEPISQVINKRIGTLNEKAEPISQVINKRTQPISDGLEYAKEKIAEKNTSGNGYLVLGILFLLVFLYFYFKPETLGSLGEIIPGTPGTGNCNSHRCPSNMKKKNLPELIKCSLTGCDNPTCCFDTTNCNNCTEMCVLKKSENQWFPTAFNIEPNPSEPTNLRYPCINKNTGIQKMNTESCTEDEHDLNVGEFSGLDLDGMNISRESCNILNSKFDNSNIKFDYESLEECLEDHNNEGQGKCYPRCEFSMEGSLQAGFDRLVNSDHISQVDPPCIYQPMKEYNDGIGVNDKYLFWGWSNSTNNDDVYSNADSIVYGKIDPACKEGQFDDFYNNDSTIRGAPKKCIDRYDYNDPIYNSQNEGEKFDIPGCARACAFDNNGTTKDIESGSDSGRRCNGFALKAYGTGDYSNTERTCLRIGSWPNNDETHNFRRYGAEGPDGGNVENCANECDTEQYSQDDIDNETEDAKVGTTTMLYPFKGDSDGDERNINGDDYTEHYENAYDIEDAIPWAGECRTLKKWDLTLLETDPSKHDEANAKTPLYWPKNASLDEQDPDRRPVFGTCKHLKNNMIHRKLKDGSTFYQDQTILNKRRPSRDIEKYTDGTTSSETKKFAVFERISE